MRLFWLFISVFLPSCAFESSSLESEEDQIVNNVNNDGGPDKPQNGVDLPPKDIACYTEHELGNGVRVLIACDERESYGPHPEDVMGEKINLINQY